MTFKRKLASCLYVAARAYCEAWGVDTRRWPEMEQL